MNINAHSFARYNRFIQSKIGRDLKGVFTHKHHITPRCIGGADVEENLISLTPREHYIAHRMLAQAIDEDGLWSAFFLMSHAQGQRVNSRTYEEAAKRHGRRVSDMFKEPEFAQRHKARTAIQRSDPEFQAKRVEGFYSKMSSPGVKQAMQEQYRHQIRNTDFLKKKQFGQWNTDKRKWQQAQSLYEVWLDLGKPKVKMFAIALGETQSRMNRVYVKFKEGWIPIQDPVWLEWKQK